MSYTLSDEQIDFIRSAEADLGRARYNACVREAAEIIIREASTPGPESPDIDQHLQDYNTDVKRLVYRLVLWEPLPDKRSGGTHDVG